MTDDGPGVAAEQVVGLVRKFERGSASGVAGCGLGLSLVDTIARQSGDRLVLQSPLADGHGFSASLCFDFDLARLCHHFPDTGFTRAVTPCQH